MYLMQHVVSTTPILYCVFPLTRAQPTVPIPFRRIGVTMSLLSAPMAKTAARRTQWLTVKLTCGAVSTFPDSAGASYGIKKKPHLPKHTYNARGPCNAPWSNTDRHPARSSSPLGFIDRIYPGLLRVNSTTCIRRLINFLDPPIQMCPMACRPLRGTSRLETPSIALSHPTGHCWHAADCTL